MTVRQAIRHLYNQPQDAFYYWEGILRYWLYKRVPRLLRWHIRDQYTFRKVAAEACYFAGECICCGCRTPELFFAAKACSAGKKQFPHCLGKRPCYPKLKRPSEWYWFRYKQLYV